MITKMMVTNLHCKFCLKMIKQEFEKFGIECKDLKMDGKIEGVNYKYEVLKPLNDALTLMEHPLVFDTDQIMAWEIKYAIIHWLGVVSQESLITLKRYMQKETGMDEKDYSEIFSLEFTETITRFRILWKIDKIKEMMRAKKTYDEIIRFLHYDSVSTFSTQFLHETGETPKDFRASLRE
jgi:AraC-like DNA-binding protein